MLSNIFGGLKYFFFPSYLKFSQLIPLTKLQNRFYMSLDFLNILFFLITATVVTSCYFCNQCFQMHLFASET